MIPRHTHHDYYACASYSQIPRVCPNIKYHRAEALEAEVVRRLSEWFSDPEATTRFIQGRLEAERKKLSSGDPEVQTTALTSRLEKLARMKANYRRQQAEELISLEDLKSVLADVDAKEREARAELDNILNRKVRLDELIAESKLILDNFAATAHIGLENLTPAERRDAYKRLHLKVTVEQDNSLTIEGDAGANYLPDVSEIREARRVESKQVGEAIDLLQKGMNNPRLSA